MFTTARCGMRLLCDSTLSDDSVRSARLCELWCDEPSPTATRTATRVTFSDTVQVRYVECENELVKPELELDTLAVEDLSSDKHLQEVENNLGVAAINAIRNGAIFRYGLQFPVYKQKKRPRDERGTASGGEALRETWVSNEAAVEYTARTKKGSP
jgi:hypothetical protein